MRQWAAASVRGWAGGGVVENDYSRFQAAPGSTTEQTVEAVREHLRERTLYNWHAISLSTDLAPDGSVVYHFLWQQDE